MISRHLRRYLAGILLLATMAAASWWSLRLARADYLFRTDTEASVARAARLIPGNAEYFARLAALRENAAAGPATIESALESAVAANPRLAAAWIARGLRAEQAQDFARSDLYFDRALESDHTYATLWTSANYYFRRDQPAKFWAAARAALRIGDVGAYDPVPLFRLCWRMSDDPETILNRGIPDAGAVQARYLEFLVRENRASVAEPVIQRVVAFSGGAELDSILGYCDRAIESGDSGRAIHAWNALCWRMTWRPLAPERGVSLTNGTLASSPAGHGFDWRIPAVTGVTIERDGVPPRLSIMLDGHEPEACDLIAQYVPLAPSKRYRLRFRYQTDGIAHDSGLRWHIEDAATNRELTFDSADLASEQETDGTARFSAPGGVSLARLALSYRRRPGTVRIEGRVSLSAVSLGFEP